MFISAVASCRVFKLFISFWELRVCVCVESRHDLGVLVGDVCVLLSVWVFLGDARCAAVGGASRVPSVAGLPRCRRVEPCLSITTLCTGNF